MTRPLKVALLSFAHTHAASYAQVLAARDDVELLTADPEGEQAADAGPRGRALADQWDVPYVDTYDEALAWGPDAVVVTSENSRHRVLVERAAAIGAHILCEKPLATTLDDGEAMLDAVERAAVTLMMAYPVRFSPTVADLRDRVAAGQLGKILGVFGTNNGQIPLGERAWFTDPELAGGGVLVDHVVHCADLLDGLLGERATSVHAAANRILHAEKSVEVETGGLVTVTYRDGTVATIDCSWSYPDSAATWGGLTLQVVGTLGTATIAPFAQHLAGYDEAGAVYDAVGDDLDAAMIDAFVASVRAGRHPSPDIGVGYRTLQVVDAARRSAESGQPAEVVGLTPESFPSPTG